MSAREDILQKVWTTAQDVTEENPTLDVPLSWSYAVVTGAAVAMADSGTIALDHSEDQRRRALSLLPDVHGASCEQTRS